MCYDYIMDTDGRSRYEETGRKQFRMFESTHDALKWLAKRRRQEMIVIVDELVQAAVEAAKETHTNDPTSSPRHD
jgi:hypothetical protein